MAYVPYILILVVSIVVIHLLHANVGGKETSKKSVMCDFHCILHANVRADVRWYTSL